ncbi:TolC family protein [Anditalea andensis]|uniref:Transporter n=1 Tax=Anditalea andensis TaxID=1048983 RepID=A0A074KU57_9BACT|nr:TolC family protein [Anditalea andensis]KEO72454.1 transporter [Anditalea andensis]
MRSLLIIAIICSMGYQANAQDTLSYYTYIEWVGQFHPVVNQADITIEMGRQEMRMARGGFDPYIYGNLDQKEFNEVGYYNKREAGLVIPTIAGIELRGRVEQNTGQYLNPEERVPREGLMSIGAAINLGQGLMIDGRRRAIQQAEIFRDAAFVDRQIMLNELYLDASEAYWNWAAAYQDVIVMREALDLAIVRFEAIKGSFLYGDLPAIDTLEAYTQVLNREYRLQGKEMDFFQRTQTLNLYLWDDTGSPMYLSEMAVPQPLFEQIDLSYDLTVLRLNLENHPRLQRIDFDLANLDLDRRWRMNQLLPVAQLHYNYLAPTNGLEPGNHMFFENNYKFGATVRTPLFLRRERGALGLVRSRIDFTLRDRDMRFANLRARLETEVNNVETLQGQYRVFGENVVGLQRLLEGEQTRFDLGESSLFLINAREVSRIEGELILNDVIARRNIAYARLMFAAGVGFSELQFLD